MRGAKEPPGLPGVAGIGKWMATTSPETIANIDPK